MIVSATMMRIEKVFARRQAPLGLESRVSCGTHPAQSHGRRRPFPGSSPLWASQLERNYGKVGMKERERELEYMYS